MPTPHARIQVKCEFRWAWNHKWDLPWPFVACKTYLPFFPFYEISYKQVFFHLLIHCWGSLLHQTVCWPAVIKTRYRYDVQKEKHCSLTLQCRKTYEKTGSCLVLRPHSGWPGQRIPIADNKAKKATSMSRIKIGRRPWGWGKFIRPLRCHSDRSQDL